MGGLWYWPVFYDVAVCYTDENCDVDWIGSLVKAEHCYHQEMLHFPWGIARATEKQNMNTENAIYHKQLDQRDL